jgi:branched-chain amino acid transport system ATP-binding protein
VIIEAHDLTKYYGGYCALDGVSLGIRDGEFVSIIGPNGAGKSTLVNVLTGVIRPTSGHVRFKDQDIHGFGAAALARLGMARSFQLVHIFPDLTVQETLEAAVVSRLRRGTRLFASLAGDREVRAAALEVAELFRLADRRDTLSRHLAQGDKKLLDVASAFALRPEVILLDEPTSGVSTADKTAIMEILVAASRRIGLRAIIQVEHDMDIVFGYSDRIIALHQGKVLADAAPAELRADTRLVDLVIGRRRASRMTAAPHPDPLPRGERESSEVRTSEALAPEGGEGGVRSPMLSLKDIDVYIQTSHILRRISLDVGEREVVCLVGRNGAGKTTALRSIMGYLRPRAGHISFRGREIQSARSFEIARMGLGFAPEDSGIFSDLTVAENIEISTWTRATNRPAAERIEQAYQVFPALRRYMARKGPEMSGGERKMLSIARALALDPDMLLLDEPFEGLSPAIVPTVSEGLASITAFGRAILIAESNIHHVPEFTTRLYVIERGEIIFMGRPEDVHGDRAVMRVIGGAA